MELTSESQSSNSSGDSNDSQDQAKWNRVNRDSKTKVSKRRKDLRTIVSTRLKDFHENDERYNGLIRLIADPEFLSECYWNIKGKKGQLTPGSDKKTLDGISMVDFEKLSDEL